MALSADAVRTNLEIQQESYRDLLDSMDSPQLIERLYNLVNREDYAKNVATNSTGVYALTLSLVKRLRDSTQGKSK